MVRPEIAGRRPTANAVDDEVDAYTIREFCERHRISIQFFYALRQQGLGPQTFRLGTRRLISREAAKRWRREREAATAAAE